MKLSDSSDPQPDPKDSSPASRLRNILSSAEEEPTPSPQAEPDRSFGKLPRSQATSAQRSKKAASPPATNKPRRRERTSFQLSRLGPPFWTITGVMSLVLNAVLIALLITSYRQMSAMSTEKLSAMGSGFLGGLYHNFEKMDQAQIHTSIPIDQIVPVKFDLQLQQQTEVVLSQDVNITGARVSLNTGGLNILSAPTNITLPAGTRLPIILNLTVPVETTVPIQFNQDVNIPVASTGLHDPLLGLQDVVRPFYCMVDSAAASINGNLLCP